MIRIIKGGIQTTVQGERRKGFLSMGFPGSGPADSLSMSAANFLTGKSRFSACLEMFIQGPTIQFESDIQIAICGAFMSSMINDLPVNQDKTINVKKGDTLRLSPAKNGMIAYLAFSGDLVIKPYLNSTSTFLTANLGGFDGYQIKNNDLLPVENTRDVPIRKTPNFLKYLSQRRNYIRVLTGPENHFFDKHNLERFYSSEYKISSDSNRIGIRMKGDDPLQQRKSDIISSAVLPGTIQIPKSGFPIVMMHDHQTTGGYARIANVITHDLDFLAQSTPGTSILFREVTLNKSQELLQKREMAIEALFKKTELN